MCPGVVMTQRTPRSTGTDTLDPHTTLFRSQARFLHLGVTIRTPVHMYEIVDGQATEIADDSAMFDYGKSGVNAGSLPKDLCFAGFRTNYLSSFVSDGAAFQRASYFRAVGGDQPYGH